MDVRLTLRVCFIIICVIVCLAQCYSIIISFFHYPSVISIYDESPSLVTVLPGLTICNNNRISLKKLMGMNETFFRAVRERFEGQVQNGRVVSIVEKLKFNDFRDGLSKLYDSLNYYPSIISRNATLDESFSFKPEDYPFIQWFGCARAWKNSIDCTNLTRIESISSRKCTTLLHRGAMLYDAYKRPKLFNTSGEGSSSLNYFDAKEVMKLVLNFEPEDYADLKRQIGARITFHDSNFVAAIGELDFFVTRGYRYDFTIDRLETKLRGNPYGKCLNYDKLNLDVYKTRVDPRVPLQTQTCYQNCVTKNVINRSKCWPISLPYFHKDSLDPELKLKFCPWSRGSHTALYKEYNRIDRLRTGFNSTKHANGTESSFYNDTSFGMTQSEHLRGFRKINRFCQAKCTLSCRIVEYTVSVTRSAWPSDVKILFDKTGKERIKRHCCALIAIKFTHYHYNIHEYKPKYDIANTIGDLGGLLAFWLGLSMVSIYRAIQKLILFCNSRSLNKICDIKLAQ